MASLVADDDTPQTVYVQRSKPQSHVKSLARRHHPRGKWYGDVANFQGLRFRLDFVTFSIFFLCF